MLDVHDAHNVFERKMSLETLPTCRIEILPTLLIIADDSVGVLFC